MKNELQDERLERYRREGVPRREFDKLYEQSTAPWETGRPQRALVELACTLPIEGDVLDAGCGTGENALWLAEQGARVVAIDFAPEAIRQARAKAVQRGVEVDFREHDALELPALGRQFDWVVDSGLLHVFSDAQRPAYVRGLHAVLRPGGRLVLMCFSDAETRPGGPRRLTRDEIHATLSDGWAVERLEASRFDAGAFEGGARAWLVVAGRS